MGLEEDIKQKKKFSNEYEKLVVNIIYTNSWLLEQQTKAFKVFDLTSPQYNVMRILKGQYPKPCTINLIIERMLDRMSNASRIVDRLEKKGLVERKTCKTDKRAKDVVLTKKGLNLLEEVNQATSDWMNKYKAIPENKAKEMNLLLDQFRSL